MRPNLSRLNKVSSWMRAVKPCLRTLLQGPRFVGGLFTSLRVCVSGLWTKLSESYYQHKQAVFPFQLTSKAVRLPLATARWTTVLLSPSTSSREAPSLRRLSKTLQPHHAAISSGVRPSLSLACTSACLPHRGRRAGQLLLYRNPIHYVHNHTLYIMHT